MKRTILALACASAALLMAARDSTLVYAHTPAGFRQSDMKSAAVPNLARMEQVIQAFVADKQFMGSVLVARGNDILLDKGYGFANLEWNIPDSPKTKFRLGSITKQFTAASILLLEERGKLSVNDSVKKYMPDAPEAWDKITILNLLTHTSGIPSFTSFPDYPKLEPFSATPTELVARFRDKPLALYSTTEDLLRWEQGLFGGKLISPASLKKMTTPFKSDYGFGLNIRTVNGQEQIEHGGGIEGFNTMLAYYPADKFTVVVLANLNGAAPQEIAADLHTIAEGGTVVLTSERKVVKIDPKIFDGYVSSYQLAPNFILKITREGDRFITQATGQGQVEIFPEGDRDFFAKVVNAQITFVTNSRGRATELILHQGGRDQHAPRVEERAAEEPKEHKEIQVDPKIFEGYVGNYQLAPSFSIRITREGDHLFEQATNQPKFEPQS